MASYNDPFAHTRYGQPDDRQIPATSNPYDSYNNNGQAGDFDIPVNSTPNPYDNNSYNNNNNNHYNHPGQYHPSYVQQRFDPRQDDDIEELDSAPPLPVKDSTPAQQWSLRDGSSHTKKDPSLRVSVEPVRKVWNGFEHGEFTPAPGRRGKTARALKAYRKDLQGNLWTKGGRGRCFGRFFCCTLMIAVLVIVSVVLALALWVRPPAVTIGTVRTVNTTGSLSAADGLAINLNVDITINNPNYFSVDFARIKAEIFYPPNDVPMGGGEATNVKFPSDTKTTFSFPFALKYRSADDPGNAVFIDLGEKCGIDGRPKSDIKVDYKITLGIRFLIITISPVIKNSFTFACPSSLLEGGVITGTRS